MSLYTPKPRVAYIEKPLSIIRETHRETREIQELQFKT